MINICKNKVMIAVCAVVTMNSLLIAGKTDRDGVYDRFSTRSLDKTSLRLISKLESRRELNNYISTLEAQLTDLDGDSREEVEGELRLLRKQRTNMMIHDGTPSKLVARGLAGDQWELLDGSEIENIPQGIIQGMTVRASKAAGDVLGKRLADACEIVLGGAWDQVFGSLVDSWHTMNNVVFHGAHKPMSQEDLAVWGRLIDNVFLNLENMLKNSLMNASRSADMSRRFDLGAMAGLNSEKKDDEEEDLERQDDDARESAWAFLMTGYTDQLNRLGSEVAIRKAYYADDSLEAFYIEQINQRLFKFSAILTDSVSINDLATRLDSNQSIIPALRENIKELVYQLDDLLRRQSHKKEDKDAYDRKRSGLSRANNNRVAGYPGSMMNESSNHRF